MIVKVQMQFNRMRQSQITNDLVDIITGASGKRQSLLIPQLCSILTEPSFRIVQLSKRFNRLRWRGSVEVENEIFSAGGWKSSRQEEKHSMIATKSCDFQFVLLSTCFACSYYGEVQSRALSL